MGEGNGKYRKPELRVIQGGLANRPADRQRSEGRRLEGASHRNAIAAIPESDRRETSSLRDGWVYFEFSGEGDEGSLPHAVERPSLSSCDPRQPSLHVLEPTDEIYDAMTRSVAQTLHTSCSVPTHVAVSHGSQYTVLHKERATTGSKTIQSVRGKLHSRDQRRFSLGLAALDTLLEAISSGVIEHLEYVHHRYAHAAPEYQLSTLQGLEDKRWLHIPRFRSAFARMVDSMFNGKSNRAELHVPLYNKADAISITVGSLALMEMLYGERPVVVVRADDSNGLATLEAQVASLGGILIRLHADTQGDHMEQQQPAPSSGLGEWLLERLSAKDGIALTHRDLNDLPSGHGPSLVERLDAMFNRHAVTDERIHRIAEQYRQHCFEQEQRALIATIQSQYSQYTKMRTALQTLERHYNSIFRRLWNDRRSFTIPSVPDLHTMEYEPSISGLHGHVQILTDAIQRMLDQISDKDDALLRTTYHIDLPLQ